MRERILLNPNLISMKVFSVCALKMVKYRYRTK